MELACPKCTSGEVRKLSVIYKEGLSIINTRTRSSSTGVAYGGGGMAFGSSSGTASTTGKQQTALSKEAAPPAKKHAILWSIAAVILGIWTLSELFPLSLGSLVLLILTAVAVRFALKGFQWNKEEYPGLYARWDQSFMCNRCGEVFVPA